MLKDVQDVKPVKVPMSSTIVVVKLEVLFIASHVQMLKHWNAHKLSKRWLWHIKEENAQNVDIVNVLEH